MDEITRLREQLDELEEENRQLRDEIGLVSSFPNKDNARVAGIPQKEFCILSLLSSRPLVRRETIVSALWNDPTKDIPDDPLKNVVIHLHRLKKKIYKYDIHVENVYGVGWRMSEESRKKAKELIAELMR